MIDLTIILTFFIFRFFPPATNILSSYISIVYIPIVFDVFFIALLWTLFRFKKSIHYRDYLLGIHRPRLVDIALGLLTGALLFVLSFVLSKTIDIAPPKVSLPEFPLGLLLIILVSLTEEIFYRSYLIKRLQRIMPSPIAILCISAFIFSLGHAFQGIYGLVFSFSAGIIFSFLMITRKSLFCNFIAHVSYNLAIYVLQA